MGFWRSTHPTYVYTVKFRASICVTQLPYGMQCIVTHTNRIYPLGVDVVLSTPLCFLCCHRLELLCMQINSLKHICIRLKNPLSTLLPARAQDEKPPKKAHLYLPWPLAPQATPCAQPPSPCSSRSAGSFRRRCPRPRRRVRHHSRHQPLPLKRCCWLDCEPLLG